MHLTLEFHSLSLQCLVFEQNKKKWVPAVQQKSHVLTALRGWYVGSKPSLLTGWSEQIADGLHSWKLLPWRLWKEGEGEGKKLAVDLAKMTSGFCGKGAFAAKFVTYLKSSFFCFVLRHFWLVAAGEFLQANEYFQAWCKNLGLDITLKHGLANNGIVETI